MCQLTFHRVQAIIYIVYTLESLESEGWISGQWDGFNINNVLLPLLYDAMVQQLAPSLLGMWVYDILLDSSNIQAGVNWCVYIVHSAPAATCLRIHPWPSFYRTSCQSVVFPAYPTWNKKQTLMHCSFGTIVGLWGLVHLRNITKIQKRKVNLFCQYVIVFEGFFLVPSLLVH